MAEDGYTRVSIPNELIQEIEQVLKIDPRGYSTITEFIKDAIRKNLDTSELSEGERERIKRIWAKKSH